MIDAEVTPTLSAAVIVGRMTCAVDLPTSVKNTKAVVAGQLTTGASISAATPNWVMTTAHEHHAELPEASVAEYVMTVRPRLKTVLLAKSTKLIPFFCRLITTGSVSLLSDGRERVNSETQVVVGGSTAMLTSVGHVIAGDCLLVMLTTNLHVLTLPDRSMAVQPMVVLSGGVSHVSQCSVARHQSHKDVVDSSTSSD